MTFWQRPGRPRDRKAVLGTVTVACAVGLALILTLGGCAPLANSAPLLSSVTPPQTSTSTPRPRPTSTSTPRPRSTPTATPRRPTPTRTPSKKASAAKSPVSQGNPIQAGKLNLTATFNSIGIELLVTGDDNANADASLEFKKSSDQTWRKGLPLWEVAKPKDGGSRAFYGSVLLADPGSTYDVRVAVDDPDGVAGTSLATGQITTRAETIAAANTLTPTYFVRPDGNDANAGTSDTPGGAWKTLYHAESKAPPGAVVQVAPGYYESPGTANKDFNRTTPLTLVAKYPAVDDHREIVNVGKHSVVDSGVISGPAGATEPGVTAAPWIKVSVTGSPTGQSRELWKWAGCPITTSVIAMGYATSRDAAPIRIAVWDRKSGTSKDHAGQAWSMSAPEGWADLLYTNKSYNYGTTSVGAYRKPSDVYLRMPGDLNPNDYYITLESSPGNGKGGAGLAIDGPNVRVSGFEIRQVGVTFHANATRGLVDHNLFVSAGVGFRGYKPSSYGSDHVVEDNRFVDSSLWSIDPKHPAIPWNWIKGALILHDGTRSQWGRVGALQENAAVGESGGARRLVMRDNTIDGYFNGYTDYNVGFDRYASQDNDIDGNLIEHIADDAIEPEDLGINIRVWDNRIDQTSTALSTGPLAYGPVYFVRNQVWRTGGDGAGVDAAGHRTVAGVIFKFSGESKPPARLFVINNTFWTDSSRGTDGSGQYAGGGGSPERFYLRNNIFRMTRYAFQFPTRGQYDEDYNYFVTHPADGTGRGINYRSKNRGSLSRYQSVSQEGAHDGPPNLRTEPALVDPIHGDLRLASGSPQIDAGVVVPNIADLPGVNYAGKAPDLGAIEHK